MRKFLLAAALLAATSSLAFASSVNVFVVVGSAPSTSVSCPGEPASFTGPVAAGTVICGPIAVLPSTWGGALSLTAGTTSGSNQAASNFGIAASGGSEFLVVGPTALPSAAGGYSVTINATP